MILSYMVDFYFIEGTTWCLRIDFYETEGFQG